MNKSVFSLRKGIVAAGSFLLLGVTLMSCLKDKDGSNNNPVSGLMAFNLVPDKSAVAFALSGNSITNSPLTYTSYTGAYVGVYPGTRTVEVYDNSATPIASTTASFEPEKYYSSFAVGANGVYRNVVVHDNFDSLSGASGQAYIRYINAIPDSSRPAVTIGGVINDQAAYASVSEFKAVTPGQVTIDVNNGGTIDAERTITVEARKVYTVLLAGVPGSAATPVEIRYVTNGQLDENDAQRVSSARSARVQ